ncbi:DNA cytosine methyltransferase [Ferribacterium limneticum]|uniref:DNA cytosine methyltransferase n=1 Tax=Ferribacterium limneticum TaxID=76259 RepID=UPI001CF904BB|nr:DNA cytosine methyltransferase [Ferribacterium limneticum]UCV23814.1 DNA cytosine methyltransferase [Ferribacterium limneticum]
MKNTIIESVDLFCGAGGLTAGLRSAGVKVKAGYDIDAACKYAFEHNNDATFVCKDVGVVSTDEIEKWYSGNPVRLLAGCAPCQPFSSYNQGRDTRLDRKWPLLYQFARLIREIRPELVTMENVPDVTKHAVYNDFVAELSKQGYEVWSGTVACVDYGLPQQRRRHVLLASLLGNISLIPPTHSGSHLTVKDALGSLAPIEAGMVDAHDPLHRAARLSPINQQRIRLSRPGGTWKDWPEELRADCHRKQSGKTYPSVYGRMSWNAPSPTMTTLCYGFGNGRFGHPEQHRAISLREAAILQSFPKEYRFVPLDKNIEFRSVGRMIGNAVPVRLGEVIGESLISHVRQALADEQENTAKDACSVSRDSLSRIPKEPEHSNP